MSEVLGGTYEVLKKIGAGGSGIVYLGHHLRLDKLVVVKQDKRHVSRNPEAVQQEMKILRNLSNTYIPHLYDYIQDDERDVAYTVMDYIDGEPLNKRMEREGHFSQAQVIHWTRQLLDALDYLHTRKPHGYVHGDVKPSNIMVTSEGDIRLIDFNIALALGADNVVIGRTEGYASPEHYGIREDVTELLIPDGTNSASHSSSHKSGSPAGYSSSGPFERVLDARSDIYSVGATLYHLLSGQRPAKHAENVVPLQKGTASTPLIAIVQKAMAPNPADRYQTAKEMRDALDQLPDRDPRTLRRRRLQIVTAAAVLVLFLAGAFLTFVGLRQMEGIQKSHVLSQKSATSLAAGNVDLAVVQALEAIPEAGGLFPVPAAAQTRRALANALGVYDVLAGFHPHKLISLPSEPIKTALSPDGSLAAVLVEKEVRVFRTDTGEEIAGPLAAEYSALSGIVFLGNDTLIYAGNGALSAFDIADLAPLWTAGNPATDIAVSADGSAVAGVYKDESMAVLYDAQTGEVLQVVDFNNKRPNVVAGSLLSDRGHRIFALDAAGQWLAVSFQGGGLSLFNLQNFNETVLLDSSPYTDFEGGFCGSCFAWSGAGEQGSIFSVYNLEDMEPVGSIQSGAPFHVQADEAGVYVSNMQMREGVLQSYAENTLTLMNLPAWSGMEVVRTNGSIASFVHSGGRTLIITSDARCLAFDSDGKALRTAGKDSRIDFALMAGEYILTADRNTPWLRLQKWDAHTDALLFSYDAAFQHSEARVTPDEYTAVLFSYNQLRLLTRMGAILADVSIPDSANVYSIYYWKDRDVVEVWYQDGLLRDYSVRNGVLVSEEQGEAPDGTHNGVYVTEDYVVETPLHGAATLSDTEGETVGTLETEGYVYDALQAGEYLVPLYLTTDDDRYGLLMDGDGEILADLPRLTDVLPNGTLIFDDGTGGLYQSRIYSLEDLMELAK